MVANLMDRSRTQATITAPAPSGAPVMTGGGIMPGLINQAVASVLPAQTQSVGGAPKPGMGMTSNNVAPQPSMGMTSTGNVAPQPVGQPVIAGQPEMSIQPVGQPLAFNPESRPVGIGAPPTGLIGAEQALQGGVMGANTNLQAAIGDIDQNSAGQMQADLTGANGPEAQAAAQARFQQSPAAQYQQEQMQRAVERSAAARGGLLGGNVLRELQQHSAGIAAQDYQNQFANLGEVANRNLAQDQMKAGLYRDLADTAMSAGITTAGMRTQAGQQIAQTAQQAAGSISSLLNQQGIAISDMMSKDISTLTDIIYQSGMQDSLDSKNLAAMLANIATGQASTVQQGNAAIGEAKAAGTIGVGNAIQGGIQQGIGLWGPAA